jgi:ribosomal protein L12E/L44/L45/RPP1/RPP2
LRAFGDDATAAALEGLNADELIIDTQQPPYPPHAAAAAAAAATRAAASPHERDMAVD